MYPFPPPIQNPSAKPAVRTEAAFAKEFPVSSGSQHRKKESEGDYGEWVPIDRKAERDKAASASISGSTAGEEECKDSNSVFPDASLQVGRGLDWHTAHMGLSFWPLLFVNTLPFKCFGVT